jgi:hypothetical protein
MLTVGMENVWAINRGSSLDPRRQAMAINQMQNVLNAAEELGDVGVIARSRIGLAQLLYQAAVNGDVAGGGETAFEAPAALFAQALNTFYEIPDVQQQLRFAAMAGHSFIRCNRHDNAVLALARGAACARLYAYADGGSHFREMVALAAVAGAVAMFMGTPFIQVTDLRRIAGVGGLDL